MSVDKRWRLVCYDVRDPKRYRQVYKIVRGAGTAVQYSIFRCRLDAREVEKLRWQLAQVMAEEDALLVVDLCPSCASNVISKNHVSGWAEEPQGFRIIGRGGDQGSGHVSPQGGEGDAKSTKPEEGSGD